MDAEPFCCECKSDFPVAVEPTSWRMGELRDIDRLTDRLRRRFAEWREHPDGHYLCGNCYFDLTD